MVPSTTGEEDTSGTICPSTNVASNSTRTVADWKSTATLFSSSFCSDLLTCHPALGADDTIVSIPSITSSVTDPASPTLYVVRNPVGAGEATVLGFVTTIIVGAVVVGKVLVAVDDGAAPTGMVVEATCSGTAAD